MAAGWIAGHDIAEAAGHARDAIDKDAHQRVAVAIRCRELSDEAVHACLLPGLDTTGRQAGRCGCAGKKGPAIQRLHRQTTPAAASTHNARYHLMGPARALATQDH